MKKSVRYNENIISYAEYGDKNGYPVFINHGLIASITDYQLFDPLIQIGARLVCVARPGYGRSSPCVIHNIAEWADLASVVIHELGLSQFDVLGMSSGAPYSYSIAHAFPDHVRNVYIFSGTPALYKDEILAHWPYEVKRDASISELEMLAHELFFTDLSEADLQSNDIRDSMMNHCFGIAQDLKLRCMDWGFGLSDIKQDVYMQHSKEDQSVPFITASLTSKLLLHCSLRIKEHGEHFSSEELAEFIRVVVAEHYVSQMHAKSA